MFDFGFTFFTNHSPNQPAGWVVKGGIFQFRIFRFCLLLKVLKRALPFRIFNFEFTYFS